jgi:predicted methyltransferase
MLLLLSGMARAELGWDAALAGEHRSEQNKARDLYRHPRETLSFFGLEAGMTVMEVSPGGGWYTEVLGPLMKGNGKLIAAHGSPNGGNYARRSLGTFLKKLGENGDVLGEVEVSVLAAPQCRPRLRPRAASIWRWRFVMSIHGCAPIRPK